MAFICGFCNRSDVKPSREHVLPEWLSKVGSTISGGGMFSREVDGKTISTPLIEVVTKRVCEPCNTLWLRRIEDSARPILTGLIDGSTSRITESEQWLIARWFYKTILTLHLAKTGRVDDPGIFGHDGFTNFYESAQLPANLLVALCGYQGRLPMVRFAIAAHDSTAVTIFFHYYRVVLLVAVISQRTDLHVPKGFHEFRHVLWPRRRRDDWGVPDPTAPVSWPPKGILDERSVDDLRHRWLRLDLDI